MGRSFGLGKSEAPCHSRRGTIKIPPCSKALNAEHRPKFCSPSALMVTLVKYSWAGRKTMIRRHSGRYDPKCFLGLSTFLLESLLDIVLFIIFFPPKKKNYAMIRIEKFYGPLCSISREMFLIHSQYLTFDHLRSYSIFCETPLLADLLKNRIHYMHENLYVIRS
jgi:hypothetical protein